MLICNSLNEDLWIYLCLFLNVEVVADDTRAIDAVVNADKKRLALLAEKDKLEMEGEKEGVDNTDRLKEVWLYYELCKSMCN